MRKYRKKRSSKIDPIIKHKVIYDPEVEGVEQKPIARPKAQYSNNGYLTLLDKYAPLKSK